jgi:hypothetical protein
MLKIRGPFPHVHFILLFQQPWGLKVELPLARQVLNHGPAYVNFQFHSSVVITAILVTVCPHIYTDMAAFFSQTQQDQYFGHIRCNELQQKTGPHLITTILAHH